jgi:hypothetical protein
MQNQKTGTSKKEAAGGQSRAGEIRLKPAGEAVIAYKESLAKPPKNKRIHPRRPLPVVPHAPPKDTGDTPDN